MERNTLGIPSPKPLPGRDKDIPYVIVADEAFPLKPNMMKPYPQGALTDERRIINYRLSRVRRIVENVFGILGSRFRIFQKPMSLSPEKAELVVLAACALHNFLRSKDTGTRAYTPEGSLNRENPDNHSVIPGEGRQDIDQTAEGLHPIAKEGNAVHGSRAETIQQEFCDYFNSVGQVP